MLIKIGKWGMSDHSFLHNLIRYSHALTDAVSAVDGKGAFVRVGEFLEGYGMKEGDKKGKGQDKGKRREVDDGDVEVGDKEMVEVA